MGQPLHRVLAIAAAIGASLASAAAVCSQTYPAGLTQLCSGVVDYPYYLPDGYTAETLGTIALTAVSSAALSLLSATCQRDIKLLVCANVYKKCVPNIDLANYATWTPVSYNGVNSVLPFERPCKSLCTATTAAGTSCKGLLEALGAGKNCAAIDPATHFPVYAEAPQACNALTAAAARTAVAGMKEAYRPGGVCEGIVETTYVPGAPKLNAALAPMAAPGVVQAMIEGVIEEKLASLPVFLSAACLTTAHKLICGIGFMPPQGQPALATILPELYMPQYPARTLCEAYNADCKGLIALAAAKGSDAAQNCTAQGADGVFKFPAARQTIVSIPMPGVGLVPLQTDPNSFENSTYATDAKSFENQHAQTDCPAGFEVPEHPDNPHNTWVPGTGCALACPAPLFTNEEYHVMQTWAIVLTAISVPLGVFMVATWTIFKKKRKQPIVIMLSAESLLVSLIFAVQYMAYPTMNDRFCQDNTLANTQNSSGYCTFQAVMLGYLAMSVACWWLCQSFDVWVRAVKQLKNVEHYIKYYAAFSMLLPSIVHLVPRLILGAFSMLLPIVVHIVPRLILGAFSMLLSIVVHIVSRLVLSAFSMLLPIVVHIVPRLILGVEGYEAGTSYCFNVSGTSKGVVFGTLYGPVAVISLIGLYFMLAVVTAIVRSVSRQGGAAKNLAMFKTPFLFVCTFLIMWCVIFALKFYAETHTETFKAAFLEWAACVFSNYKGEDNDAYIGVCGPAAPTRMPLAVAVAIIISLYGQVILIFTAYGITNKENFTLWGEYFGCIGAASAKVASSHSVASANKK
ncbi:hypothetical protein JKP88DRAFT_274514 [Tribonema minus]|uniref:Uncharacterized protein n=1 Tax=Tribonema minus TaxID=303371 RepID=A0A835YI81_9STRA|nr:hypothetical protein JKP88DRAFT_274514 [Tribonema minus]